MSPLLVRDPEAETIKTSIFREVAMTLVRIYKQHIWPEPFDRIYYLDGLRVRMTIEEYQPKEQ